MNSSDPATGLLHRERRRRIRHKLHTPVYASFNGPQSGMVVDLSELLNLNEEGFAVQTSERLEVNRAVTVCLDLPETKNYIHCTGQVIWSDDAGRGGIRFSGLPEKSQRILRQWLFANLMIACANRASRAEQLARREHERVNEPAPAARPPSAIPAAVTNAVPTSPGSATNSAVEAVRLVARDLGDDLDAIFQLITERALSFTAASGAALAFLTDDKMICRARAGETAPPLGTPVNVSQGLTGECVRTGLLVSCEDTENDPRVDPQLCRALGIRSLMAAPIVFDLQVIGLLEIFSPQPRSFTSTHGTLLARLVELIPRTRARKVAVEAVPPPLPANEAPPAVEPREVPVAESKPAPEIREPSAPAEAASEPEPLSEPAPLSDPTSAASPRLLYRALLGLAIVVVFVAIGYLLAPILDKRLALSPQASQRPASEALPSTVAPPPAPGPETKLITDLIKLAEQGNADAQWQLGTRYHNGEGVPRDDVQAIQWFQRAAEQGHVTAQATLGAYYWAGRGVPQDLSKAYFWSALALAQGDETSKARLEGLATQMTHEQISAARQQAELWLHNHTRPETN